MPPKLRSKSAKSKANPDALNQPTISKYFSPQGKNEKSEPDECDKSGEVSVRNVNNNQDTEKEAVAVKSVHDTDSNVSGSCRDSESTENISEDKEDVEKDESVPMESSDEVKDVTGSPDKAQTADVGKDKVSESSSHSIYTNDKKEQVSQDNESEDPGKEDRESEDTGKEDRESEDPGKEDRESEDAGKEDKESEDTGKEDKESEDTGKDDIESEDTGKEDIGDEELMDTGKEDKESEDTGKGDKKSEDTGKEDKESKDTGKENKESEDTGKDDIESEDTGKEDKESEDTGKDDIESEDTGKDDIESEDTGKEDKESEDTGKEDKESEDTGKEDKESEDTGKKHIDSEDTGKEDIGDEELMDTTQSYDIDLPDYTEADFGSCSEEEVDQKAGKQKMGGCTSKDSGSESEEEKAKPWHTKGAKSKKKPAAENKGSKSKKAKAGFVWSFTRSADKDTQNYRDGYPSQVDDPKKKANLQFYKGEIPSYPDGDYIDAIHQDWWGDYRLLERHHGYIQWLFPIREDGMNWSAQALQLHEAEGIKADSKAKKRVLRSYELMLDFYGMKLVDKTTGQLTRSKGWRDRFDNLSWSSHNYLRITRILKSLGELGYEYLKTPFLKFVLEEALVKGTLQRTIDSCRNYWIGAVKDDADRDMLHAYIEEYS